MNLTITAEDGHRLPVYEAKPAGEVRGGVVLFHEAFGVTPHIQQMADWLAGERYHVLAPEMLARAVAKAEDRALSYNKEGLEAGRRAIIATPREKWMADAAACVAHLQGKGLKAATLGYCWGGSLAYMTACTVPNVACADCYYGGMLADLVAMMQPACPVQFHLAVHDRYIPLAQAEGAIKVHLPQASLHVYDADHGFNRTGGATYNDALAQQARARTLVFLAENLAK
ncbi:MAG: dienelactone hydrolase family protein [Pseudomonadaceae bacterium]|nr:dienelactone hydrolase family protein [Pseudomonadaceae bacterium]